jgi:hypothetical protein
MKFTTSFCSLKKYSLPAIFPRRDNRLPYPPRNPFSCIPEEYNHIPEFMPFSAPTIFSAE